jgi:ADP-heptose:LPS heptosyltransferase/SAM-dependent methyltransferase|tara:strand:+ start:2143 stop:4575 length:2433 start_codon:yes stop_codon:yes gene_type:complete
MNKDTLASVILLGENAGDDEIQAAVKNIFEQTHKNIDLIISTFHEELSDDLKASCDNFFLNVRWVKQAPSALFLKELVDLADGEVVFYKTVNNVLWFPRHIEAHFEEFGNDNKLKWALSHVENRNLDQADSQFNTLSYRIDNPPHPDTIAIDEICHYVGIDVDWSKCLSTDGEVPTFLAGHITRQWIENRLRGSIPKEITVVQWVSPNKQNGENAATEEEVFKKVGVPKETEIKEEMKETDDGIEIVRSFPTVMGSFYHKEYSDGINGVINQTENITSIGIKRTIGMGDVVVVEPIIRKLREKFPQASITLYTHTPKVVEYFESKPDEVIEIDQNSVPFDVLADKDHQVKYDLDLSYESRENVSFIDGYAEVASVEFEDEQDKHVRLMYDKDPLIVDKKYAVVVADGSAWPGKTWGVDNYKEVIKWLQERDYEVVETGAEHTDITSDEYHECDFKVMMNLIAHCDLFVGGDNGPMHIARGFNKPCVLIAGAARPYYTTPNRDNVVYVEDHTSKGLGIKHKTFLTISDKGINFVPNFDEEPTCGLKNIKPLHVMRAIEKLWTKPTSPHGNPSSYEMNIPGNLVLRDVLPGFAYYRDDVTNIIWRENRHYHPDQRIDCSVGYDADKEATWDSRFLPIIDYIEDKSVEVGKVLDVGCNMGIFVYGATQNKNWNVTGIDLNKHAINRARSIHPTITDKFIHSSFLRYKFDDKFHTLVCSDVINHTSDPKAFLTKCNDTLDDQGNLFISFYDFDSKSAGDKRQQWDFVGVGEIITFFSDEVMMTMLHDSGFEVVDDYYKDDDVDGVRFIHCRKVA